MKTQHLSQAQSPSVGIFWLVPNRDGHTLLSEAIPLLSAEVYGDCLTYPRGHYEVWEEWQQRRPSKLLRGDLSAIIASHEYEYFPRGRVVYEQRKKRFIIYADRKLLDPAIASQIVRRFGLEGQPCTTRTDDHYCS